MLGTREQPTPTPNVEYLPTIFRRIRSGEIKVPAFQRPFVWGPKQILALLESVYRGYPIGSLLLWRVDKAILKIGSTAETEFPDTEVQYPLSYLLDGMQRLATLYGVFNYDGDRALKGKFNVIFNLEDERFQHYDERDLPRYYVRLSDLFSPRELLRAQSFIGQQEGGDKLIERTIVLQSTFQEYLVPMVTIAHRDVGDVVQIFERINSTGTPLGPVDFMRAATWSEEFDLSRELTGLREWLDEIDFGIPDETIVKMVGIVMGRSPLADDLLSLREAKPEELLEGISSVRGVIERCSEMLRDEFRIFSYDYVPYEGQMLVFTRMLVERERLDRDELEAILRWYWRTSFNEALQGRPDHYVARLVERFASVLDGSIDVRVTLSPDDLRHRLFTRGKALSSAVASMFAWNSARSLVTGEVIPAEVYMTEFTQAHFERVLSGPELAGTGQPGSSPRVISNILVVTDEDRRALGPRAHGRLLELVEGHEGRAVLASQFVPTEAVECLRRGDLVEFLGARARSMFEGASRLMA